MANCKCGNPPAHKNGMCRDCRKEYNQEWYRKNKQKHKARARENFERQLLDRHQFVFDYFATHPCIDCGENDPVVLDFDHRGNKSYTISNILRTHAWATVLKEIAKCDVRCSNCHRRKTAKQFDWYKWSHSPTDRALVS